MDSLYAAIKPLQRLQFIPKGQVKYRRRPACELNTFEELVEVLRSPPLSGGVGRESCSAIFVFFLWRAVVLIELSAGVASSPRHFCPHPPSRSRGRSITAVSDWHIQRKAGSKTEFHRQDKRRVNQTPQSPLCPPPSPERNVKSEKINRWTRQSSGTEMDRSARLRQI